MVACVVNRLLLPNYVVLRIGPGKEEAEAGTWIAPSGKGPLASSTDYQGLRLRFFLLQGS